MTSAFFRRGAAAVATTAAAALLLAACSAGGGTDNGDAPSSGADGGFADMNPVTLRVATIYGPDNYSTLAIERYTEAVTEATEGKVEFEFFYAGSLLPQNEMAGGLSDGTIDFAEFMPVYTPSDFPVDNWATKLAFLSDSSPIVGSLQGRAATKEFAFAEAAFAEELESNNMHGLVPRLNPVHGYDLVCKDPVTSLSDIAGKRIRVGGEAWAQEITNLGGTPVTIPAAEAYTALQQGVVDCHLGGAQEIDGMGLTDVAKHYTILNLTGWTSASVALNADTWADLPEIAQQAFVDQLPVLFEARAEETFGATYTFFDTAAANGVVFHEPDAAVLTKIDEYHAGLATSLVAEAPAQIADPAAAIAMYQDLHEKWFDIITNELGMSAEARNWPEYVELNDGVVETFADFAQRVNDELAAIR